MRTRLSHDVAAAVDRAHRPAKPRDPDLLKRRRRRAGCGYGFLLRRRRRPGRLGAPARPPTTRVRPLAARAQAAARGLPEPGAAPRPTPLVGHGRTSTRRTDGAHRKTSRPPRVLARRRDRAPHERTAARGRRPHSARRSVTPAARGLRRHPAPTRFEPAAARHESHEDAARAQLLLLSRSDSVSLACARACLGRQAGIGPRASSVRSAVYSAIPLDPCVRAEACASPTSAPMRGDVA